MPEPDEEITILIIDDEAPFREDLAAILEEEGFRSETVSSGEEALDLLQDHPVDVALCDVVMPGMTGLEVLERIEKLAPETGVFMVTAYGNMDSAVEAFRQGAYDYITKPINVDEVVEKIQRYLAHQHMSQEINHLRRRLSQKTPEDDELIGESAVMEEIGRRIQQVAPTNSTVLITGESGTGKELAAREIHCQADGDQDPFVAVNCSSLAESLLESELFGHAKGAFTGADEAREGYFEAAEGGTLFLDEVSEMSPPLQAKLLRALENKEIQRVGETRTRPIDVRIVAASNRNLKQAVQEGTMREDLFYRLNVYRIEMPPLRERRSDIPLLLDHFIQQLNESMNRRVLGAENQAVQQLMLYDWPGNVRELRNLVERWMIQDRGEFLREETLPSEVRDPSREAFQLSDDLNEAVQAYERQHIQRVLKASEGNRTEAAKRLGIDPSTLYRKLDRLNISS